MKDSTYSHIETETKPSQKNRAASKYKPLVRAGKALGQLLTMPKAERNSGKNKINERTRDRAVGVVRRQPKDRKGDLEREDGESECVGYD